MKTTTVEQLASILNLVKKIIKNYKNSFLLIELWSHYQKLLELKLLGMS